ncbi:cytoplasmic tRNA 2-thiolation protein 2 [Pichia californica]|uniref:Cytoplasmic tRNA 2-thiolation protein 2 n=1 Tax=Pichia californica TaxID=460514 RepID=A0A9P7BEU7_9ASCO|nr:cytoplasmic tRNA 2-thiolation protein 2 [[Candida] californica]
MAKLGDTCKRCKKEPTTIESRKDEFCSNCFIRFIRGKQRKQMQDEKFKVKFSNNIKRPKILFDMQNDHQSYVLLDILISMLEEQLTQGPKALRGFDLIISIINDTYHIININKIIEFYTLSKIERLGIQFKNIDCEDYIKNNKFQHLKLDLPNFQTFIISDNNENLNSNSNIKSYQNLLDQISDNSTKEDLINIIHDDIILQTAKDFNCTILIKPDSMTQIAINILSDTIRGRGSEIPLKTQDIIINNTNNSNNNFEIIHPLRDILNSEIKIYSNIRLLNNLSPILNEINLSSDKSNRNKSVGEMVSEYFKSLEIEYPETVSTVVKIGAKLSNFSSNNENEYCEICKVSIYHDPKQWLEQITVPGCVKPQSEEEFSNLKRYLDSINDDDHDHDEKIVDLSSQPQVKLCYGCMVTLGVSNVTDFDWPKRPTKEEILSEYILDDQEDD